jgi:hypothetical protein
MVGRILKRVALLTFCGVGLTLASCSSTGFAGSVYMSPDSDGKRTETDFYSDYTDTPSFFFVVPIVSGRNDETLNIYVKVKSIFGEDVTGTFKTPILVTSSAPGVQTKPSNVIVQFPDPPPIQELNPADPTSPIMLTPPRAVGKFQFIASMGGDTEAVNFEILPPLTQPLADPNAGTPNAAPQAGNCVVGSPPPLGDGTAQNCPTPQGAHAIVCCTAAQDCGTGVEGTGLCF